MMLYLFENNFKVLNYLVILSMSFVENYKCKVIKILIIFKKKERGNKEGNEKWFCFLVNISLLIKEE